MSGKQRLTIRAIPTFLFLLITMVATGILLSGCQDTITDASIESQISSPEDLNALGKKGGNGGKPGSSDLPVTVSINVTDEGIHADAKNWLTDPHLIYSSAEILSGAEPYEFFGCPDVNLDCYKIVVEIEPGSGQLTDRAGIKILPFITSDSCASADANLYQACPWDDSYGDSRRLFSLTDSYIGTPYILLSDFDGSTATFFWQGQRRTSLYNGSSRVSYWLPAFDTDPGSETAFYRFEPVFFNGQTSYSSTLADVDCVSPSSSVPTTCVKDIASLQINDPEFNSMSIEFSDVGRRGKGRRATSVILVDHIIGGEPSSYDIWGVYAVHNFTSSGTTISKFVESTSALEISISAEEGCLSVRPVSGQHISKQSIADLTTTFDSAAHPAWIFDVKKDGTLTVATAGGPCL